MIKNKYLAVIGIVYCMFSFGGCDDGAGNKSVNPVVRAALKATGNGSIRAQVYVEGPDGNALSGAVVTVKDDNNVLLHLSYDTASCSYTGLLEEYAGDTVYAVEVNSILSKNVIILEIPYTAIANTPNIIVFQDSDGNSVLKGQAVVASQPVIIGWDSSGDDIVYILTIRTTLKSVYTITTNACLITVPEKTIPAGVYVVEISAQKIHGDVYFRSLPYYSASFINAPILNCHVN